MTARTLMSLAALAASGQALGSFQPATPLFSVVSTAGSASTSNSATQLAPGVYAHTGGWLVSGASVSWTSNVLGWSDSTNSGFLNSNIVVKNNTATSQTFLFTVTMMGTTAGSATFGGSLGGQFVNAGPSLGSLTSSGPLWSASIDGAAVNTQLNNALFFALPFSVESIGSSNFSNQAYASSIASSISVKYSLTLSAGGEATFNSSFSLQVVPSPAALALFGFTPLMGSRRRRR
ncbi:MAG: hypothetical protein EXS03_06860 [Phycisphaerales bacterium]|nr:hypothetical protein [Phycisphaerales bacterium]